MEAWEEELLRIRNGIKEIHNEAVDIVLANYEGIVKQRIFNESGAETSDGKKLRFYNSQSWKNKRISLGRQVANKDFSFSGELERSLKVVNIDDDRALVVTPVQYLKGRFYGVTKPKDGSKKQPKEQILPTTEQVSNYIDTKYGETFEPTEDEVKENNRLLDTLIEEKFNELQKQR